MMARLANRPARLVSHFWVAPAFAATLGAITLITFWLVKPHSYEEGLPTFLCFLPMAFYFAASVQAQSGRKVRELEERIERLEAKAGHPAV